MKTQLHEIIDVSAIGKAENPIALNDILALANAENLTAARKDGERVLVIGIDIQNDFLDNGYGSLAVPGACADTARFIQFIYNNMPAITSIAASIDTHIPHQIFHPCWWVDKDGKNPAPFTAITSKDLDNGNWFPIIDPVISRKYVDKLEEGGKKVLVIWPYHCIQGTIGAALENQFSNIINFWSVARKGLVQRIVKGQDPHSEMYGIIRPEYSADGYINLDFLNKMETFDKIIIGGQAKSHCVMESIKQMLEHFANKPDLTKKVFILEDCMSVIPSFEAATEAAFAEFVAKYGVNIVKSTDLKLV